MHFNRKSKNLLTVIGLVAVAALVAVGAAFAITQTVLADANTVNDGAFHSERGVVKLHTKGSVRIRDVQTTGAPPGFTSGWHTHPGPVLVAMSPTSAGSLTLYDEDCTRIVIAANQVLHREAQLAASRSQRRPGRRGLGHDDDRPHRRPVHDAGACAL